MPVQWQNYPRDGTPSAPIESHGVAVKDYGQASESRMGESLWADNWILHGQGAPAQARTWARTAQGQITRVPYEPHRLKVQWA